MKKYRLTPNQAHELVDRASRRPVAYQIYSHGDINDAVRMGRPIILVIDGRKAYMDFHDNRTHLFSSYARCYADEQGIQEVSNED